MLFKIILGLQNKDFLVQDSSINWMDNGLVEIRGPSKNTK